MSLPSTDILTQRTLHIETLRAAVDHHLDVLTGLHVLRQINGVGLLAVQVCRRGMSYSL